MNIALSCLFSRYDAKAFLVVGMLSLTINYTQGENLIANSSFEVGPGKWGQRPNLLDGERVPPSIVRLKDVEKLGKNSVAGAKDGDHALVLYRRKTSIENNVPIVETRANFIVSQAIEIKPGHTYSLSAYAKISSDEVAGVFSLRISNKDTDPSHSFDRGTGVPAQEVFQNTRIDAANAWTPVKLEGLVLDGERFEYYVVSVKFTPDDVNLGNDGVCWVDAIQLEESGQATDYAPQHTFEAGVISANDYNIYVEGDDNDGDGKLKGKDTKLTIALHNGTATKVSGKKVLCTIYDLFGYQYDSSGTRYPNNADPVRFSHSLPKINAHETAVSDIQLDSLKRGFYRVVIEEDFNQDGQYRAMDEIFFSILPKKRNLAPEDSMAGAVMNLEDDALIPLSRAGFHWSGTLSAAAGFGRWKVIQRNESDLVQDTVDRMRPKIQKAKDQYNINLVGHVSALKKSWVPGWVPTEAISGKTVPERDAYRTFVQALATGYEDLVGLWIIDDEAESYYGQTNELRQAYIQRFDDARDVILQTNVNAKVLPYLSESLTSWMIDNATVHLDGVNTGEGSVKGYHHMHNVLQSENPGQKIDIWGLQRKYNTNPYFTYPDFEHRDLLAAPRENAQSVQSFHIRRKPYSDIILSYTGKIDESRAYAMHSFSMLTFDGSLTPRACILACLWWLIDGTETDFDGEMVSLDKKLYTHLFRRKNDGRYILSVVTNEHACDQMAITVAADPASLTFYDGFANVFEPESLNSGLVSIGFNEQGFFVEGNSKDQLVQLAQAIGKSRVDYLKLPMGRPDEDDFTERKDLLVPPFGVSINEDHNIRLFVHGQEVITSDHIRLLPGFQDYRFIDHALSSSLVDEADSKVTTTLVKGTATVERVIGFNQMSSSGLPQCTISWKFINQEPPSSDGQPKKEMQLLVNMDDRFYDLRPLPGPDPLNPGTNWNSAHGIHPFPQFILLVGDDSLTNKAVQFDFISADPPMTGWVVSQVPASPNVGRVSGRVLPAGDTHVRQLVITALESGPISLVAEDYSMDSLWAFEDEGIVPAVIRDIRGAPCFLGPDGLEICRNNDGVNHNAAITPDGKVQQALKVGQDTGYVSIENNDSNHEKSKIDPGKGAFSIAFWMKKENSGETFRSILYKGTPDALPVLSPGFGFILSETVGQLKFLVNDEDDNIIQVLGPEIDDTLWHHVTGTKEDVVIKIVDEFGNSQNVWHTRLRLYFDGELYQEVLTNPRMGSLTNTEELFLGRDGCPFNVDGPAGPPALNGWLDEVQYFNRALIEDEVSNYYRRYRSN